MSFCVLVGNLNVPSSKYAECMGYNSNGISTTAPAVEGAGIIIISEPEASALVGKARVDVLGRARQCARRIGAAEDAPSCHGPFFYVPLHFCMRIQSGLDREKKSVDFF